MANGKESAVEKPVRNVDDENEATLAAIDEGIGDADAGRTIPIKKVRESLRPNVATPGCGARWTR